MKKIIGFLPTWILYYIGDLSSIIMVKFDFYFLYGFYNICMITSTDIQDWAGLKKPWIKSNSGDNYTI